MTYSKQIFDSIGNAHPRKNQYIIDLINLPSNEKKSFISKKDSHPYIQKIKKISEEEKSFLELLKVEVDQKFGNISNKKLQNLQKELYKAEKKYDFYKKYEDLSYDYELHAREAELRKRYIPGIIDNERRLQEELEDRQERLKNLDQEKRKKDLIEIEEKTKERKLLLEKELKDIKDKYHEGIISKSAYKNESKIKKRSAKEDITAIGYLDEKKSLEQDIANIKHHLDIDYKSKLKVMESDISDSRRKIPVEIEKKHPITSYLSILIPGLGQLFNKQFAKAIFFFIGTLFIYLIAIPYALGYGNYQGQGIAGLISLAEGGRRVDKSVIFMIEGIIAIVLLLLSVFIIYISFKDARTVEKDMIKGIRPRSWFETRQAISEEGFPYLVSTPAFLVVLFIVIIPIFTTILISFTNYNPQNQSKFAWFGLENYKMVALGKGIAGKPIWLVLGWTIIWTFAATTLAIAIGFILSLLANQSRIKFKGFFRTVYLLPWAVPAFITIMFFSLMVSRDGPITQMIYKVFGVAVDIKNNTFLTRLSVILLQGWLGSAYIFLLSTGILQGIPNDLYEAAEIDGATGLQQTLRITIPLVVYQTAPLLIGQYTFNFNNFSIIYLFNGGGPFQPSLYGNLAGSSDLLISYIYKLTIESNYQGVGAAITLLVSLVLMFFSWLGFRNTKAFKED